MKKSDRPRQFDLAREFFLDLTGQEMIALLRGANRKIIGNRKALTYRLLHHYSVDQTTPFSALLRNVRKYANLT
jgi:hypothetical protein